jgi:hypothetical protein
MENWSEWRSFPDPRSCGVLIAPFGPGCYELRRNDTGKKVLFGMGGHLAVRMTALLPRPYGCGTRKNQKKREYVLKFINEIEYRTLACTSRREALECERQLKANSLEYEFGT